tara:strand:+ start:107 stop:370 length:264 start_codon:yes stop_codon:yes gene_type:complete
MSEKNKYRLTITEAHNNMYKVEMTDKHCSYCCVYEPSIEDALAYAGYWFAETEARHEANQTHAKAVMQMNKIDKEAGILTGNYDGLD